MAADSKIQWTDKTWNPTRGCSIVSPGCINCYAMKQAHRFSGAGKAYEGLTKQTKAGPQWTGKVRTVESALLEPLSWRKPQRVFVNSMSDLFHEDVPDQFIVDVFGVMALAHWHTFQVLTKRADRMRSFLAAGDHGIVNQFKAIQDSGGVGPRAMFEALSIKRRDSIEWQWPLPNVWLGCSVENQQYADARIPLLLQTPAAVRFISAEPLLGPIHLDAFEKGTCWRCCGGGEVAGDYFADDGMAQCDCADGWDDDNPGLDWVIIGGESGPGARPFDLAWGRSIVEQCKAAGVPVFVKQVGTHPIGDFDADGQTVWTVSAHGLRDRNGGDPLEWPADLRVREFPVLQVV